MKPEETKKPLLLFYAYSHKDEPYHEKLETHLRLLVREGLISEWHDRKILPGNNWAEDIDEHLEAASLILLLVSPDFLASDYCYEIEMQRALERDKRKEAKVVPIILRPCEWQRAPFAYLQCLPKAGKAVTNWSNEDDAFLNITQGLRSLIESTRPPAHTLPREQMQNRQRLMKRVRTTWIDGLLTHALQQSPPLDITLQEEPGALDNPWGELIQELDRAPNPYPSGTTITQVFDQADGRLLILGKAGAGKTIQLLQLTHTLLERAEHDTRQPLPVIFVLSSWARKRRPLAEWILEELKVRYQIPHAIATRLLTEQQILPLLDGLDEVAANAREACIQAINTYIQNYLDMKNIPLVLTSRYEEYNRLGTHAGLQKAVSVLPLSPGQVEQYLQSGGPGVATLRQALQTDANLAEMARTPLLLNIFMLTYMDSQLADLPLGLSYADTLPILFSNYVRRMLNRRGVLRSANNKQSITWLTFLAKQMRKYDQTIFSIETIQPSGITARQDWAYRVSYMLEVGLLFFLVLGSLTFLTNGLGFWLDNLQGRVSYLYFEYKSLYTLGRMVIDRHLVLPLSFYIAQAIPDAISIGLFVAFCATITAFLIIMKAKDKGFTRPEIQPQEILNWDWSWNNVRIALMSGLLAGSIIGLFAASSSVLPLFLIASALVLLFYYLSKRLSEKQKQQLEYFYQRSFFRNIPWQRLRLAGLLLLALACLINLLIVPEGYTAMIIAAPPTVLLVGMLRIASGTRLTRRGDIHPNEGIWRSARNGLALGLVITLSILPTTLIVEAVYYHTLYDASGNALIFGPIIGIALGLYFGLSAFLRHFTLRFLLWLEDYLPWNIAGFLDEMIERLFLQRIGGSYIFIHRSLLDYFAGLTPAQQTALEKSATVTPTSRTGRVAVAQLPQRLFNKRRSVALITLTGLLVLSSLSYFINARVQAAGHYFPLDATATASFATIAALDQQLASEIANENYPANFPGHGIIDEDAALMGTRTDPFTTSACSLQSDGAHILVAKPENISICDSHKREYSNVAMRVTLTLLSGDCAGIVLRFDPNTGMGYFLYLCQNHTYGLLANLSDKGSVNLIPPTSLPANLPATNTLALVALNQTLTIYLNGEELSVIHNTWYMQGLIGMAAWDKQHTTEARYSDFEVWNIVA